MSNSNNITALVEEDDVMLPDGWTEGDDIFDEANWAGATTPTDEPEQEPDQPVETDLETAFGLAPTPEPEPEREGETPEENVETPTPETPTEIPETKKLKFKARVDREDRDVELDESELPDVYQKAQATDRYQAKIAKLTPQLEKAEQLAKTMGFDSLDAMLASAEENYQKTEVNRLVGEGVHEEVAKDIVARKMQARLSTPAPESATAPEPEQAPTRDFRAEIAELRSVRPDLDATKPLPQEVMTACVRDGKRLIVAYTEYEAQKASQIKAENERLTKKVKVMEQNASAAARSPVAGVTGGGPTDTKPKSDFERGFDSVWG